MASIRLQLVEASNNWECIACVASCLTGKSKKDFFEFCGHDGSEHNPASDHPEERRSFLMQELAGFLAKHNLHFGCHLTKDFKVDASFSRQNTAVLTVVSEKLPVPNMHVVVWTGEKVLDSNYAVPQDLDRYRVTEWWPVIVWSM